jgi:hypothetical protein
VEAELRKEPTADEGAYNSYEEVADDSKPGALHDLPSQPPGDETDQQYDQETFTRHVHIRILQMHQPADEFPPAQVMQVRSSKTASLKADIRLFKEEGMSALLRYSNPLPRRKLFKIDHIKRPLDCSVTKRTGLGVAGMCHAFSRDVAGFERSRESSFDLRLVVQHRVQQ